MIGSDKLNYVYIGPPKTGTLSVRNWLTTYFSGKVIGGYHQAKVPEKRKDAFKFMTVRHPDERLWSWYQWELYQLRTDRVRRNPDLVPHLGTFGLFIRYLTEMRGKAVDTITSPQLTLTQYDYFKLAKCDMTAILECLPEQLSCLPFANRNDERLIKHTRQTPGKAPINITKEEKELVREYCPEDFGKFGYDR